MQIPLELKLRVKASLDAYVSEGNSQPVQALTDLLQSSGHGLVYLWGKADTGKTHLLAGLCERADAESLNSIYLPLAQAHDFSPEICDGLEQADLVCLDDIDRIAADQNWETALFHLYNRLRDLGKKLLVSSTASPANSAIQLADLKSRLAWGVNLHLHELSDDAKKQVLQQRAKQLGMSLPDETANFLLRHHKRQLGELLGTLQKLDQASLAAQRKLTVPFVRDILAEQEVTGA
ncbi:MAG: DnaA regulatory inactivator Hda [Chromatiales bacterium]